MGLFDSFDVSATGMTAQRTQLDLVSQNIANVNTTRTSEGGPYARRMATFTTDDEAKFVVPVSDDDFGDGTVALPGGVKVAGVVKDMSTNFTEVYDPTHPDADPKTGKVKMPNINIVQEMTRMMFASRAFEANVTSINAAKSMAMKALEIGRGEG